MWKKIHSNRDPRDTLYREMRKEFATYFNSAGDTFRRIATAYPRFLFGSMILLLLVSFVLSFTVFHHPDESATPTIKKVSPIEDGFNQIMKTTGNIRETIRLKKLVDSLTAKKNLTAGDSVLLGSALDRLSQMGKVSGSGPNIDSR